MKTAGWVLIGTLSVMSLGCASARGPEARVPANVAGEWRGVATVGPRVGCCKGSSGPVLLVLVERGGGVSGSLQGTGFRGTVSARWDGTDLFGTCDCATTNVSANLAFEASISGDEMLMQVGDARMTLTRAP